MLRTLKAALLLMVLAIASKAASVSINPAAITDTGWNPCGSYPGYSCDTTANFSSESLNTVFDNGIGILFSDAFNAWNATNPANGQWTLDNGGTLTGTFDVTTATAQQFSNVVLGGLTININVSDLTLPNVPNGDQLVWAQGLYLNFEVTTPLGSPAVTPFYTMDTSTFSALACDGVTVLCPPAYPYQYPDNHFYDQPKADYLPPGTTQSFFDANAYLAVEDPTNRVLTVYDGVSYGFQNYVSPEPAAWILFGSGLLIVVLTRKRRLAA